MAAIIKRNNRYCVVYPYTTPDGVKKQKWETYKTMAEAKTRKKEIEYRESIGTFVVPQCHTLKELLNEYTSLYGKQKWALSTYSGNIGLINHYILPFLGDMKLPELTSRVLEKYYLQLLKTKAVEHVTGRQSKNGFVTTSTVRNVHKILRNCFEQAVKWELMEKNPALHATVPKHNGETRDIWTAETIFKATEACDSLELKIYINLAFSCTLRIGEMLGLTWDCVDLSPEAIEDGIASITINKELQRVRRDALESLDRKDVILVFPAENAQTRTILVLKTPKTQSSVRKVFLPPTVAAMLREWKEEQDRVKDLLGDDYRDFNLVLAGPNGMPTEGNKVRNLLNQLIRENNLPKVVFHSFRHSSITYKLKLNNGDVKAVQGDSGHAQTSMVTDVYSHILDDDRKRNAQLFEEMFYSGKGKTSEVAAGGPGAADKPAPSPDSVDESLKVLGKLLANPETANLLKTLASAIKD